MIIDNKRILDRNTYIELYKDQEYNKYDPIVGDPVEAIIEDYVGLQWDYLQKQDECEELKCKLENQKVLNYLYLIAYLVLAILWIIAVY